MQELEVLGQLPAAFENVFAQTKVKKTEAAKIRLEINTGFFSMQRFM